MTVGCGVMMDSMYTVLGEDRGQISRSVMSKVHSMCYITAMILPLTAAAVPICTPVMTDQLEHTSH